MNVQTYLHTKLTNCAQYELTAQDKDLIQKEGIEAYIYQKLTSKKFRKYKMTDSSIAFTKESIAICVANNQPLSIFYPQGGYKLWRLPSSPEVDWAEFFTIAYTLSYIAPIAAAYQPGVHLQYFFHTYLMRIHDNLTEEEIQAYGTSFQHLINRFKEYLPENLQLSILRDSDLYTWDEYTKELEELKKIVEIESTDWPIDKKERLEKTAWLNYKWDGAKDLTKLSDDEKAKIIHTATLYEEAVPRLKRIGEAVKSAGNILLFNKAGGNFIGIGTSKTSIAKYWVGIGVLKLRGESYQDYILSPKQMEAETFSEENIEIDDLDGKNFHTIKITQAE